MYQLQKYQTKASRHECPNCHDPHSFTYYVDDNGGKSQLSANKMKALSGRTVILFPDDERAAMIDLFSAMGHPIFSFCGGK